MSIKLSPTSMSPKEGASLDDAQAAFEDLGRALAQAESWTAILSAIRKAAALNVSFNRQCTTLIDELPLHYATEKRLPSYIIEELLKAGADPFLKDSKGNPPFFYTTSIETLGKFAYWSKVPLDEFLETRNDAGHTLLSNALLHWRNTEEQEPAWVRYLLSCGAKIPTHDDQPGLLLEMVAKEAHPKAAQILLKNGFSPEKLDEKGNAALYNALRSEQIDFALTLIGNGAKFELREWETLLDIFPKGAFDEKHNALAQFVLKNYDPLHLKRFGWSPLHFAARCGQNVDLMSIVKPENINTECQGNTALKLAIDYRQFFCAFFLLQNGGEYGAIPNINTKGAEKIHGLLDIYRTHTQDGDERRANISVWIKESIAALRRESLSLETACAQQDAQILSTLKGQAERQIEDLRLIQGTLVPGQPRL